MSGSGKSKYPQPTFVTNRKARRDYDIIQSYEAGIELKGTEIKSIRQHQASLEGSFARIDEGELFLYNMNISPYVQGGRENVEPTRTRRLLMHRHEIERIMGFMSQRRLSLVPLRVYQRHGMAKVELALCRGRRMFEKRDKIRRRQAALEAQRAWRNRQARR